MPDFLSLLLELIQENWAKAVGAIIGLLIAGWYGGYRAKKQWEQRKFFDRLNISLNVIEGGYLRIRTILEDPLPRIFLNKAAADLVLKAAKKTTLEDPILPLKKEDRWFVNNEILNQISEQFSDALIRFDMGKPVDCHQYIIAMTCEKAGAVRTQKVRAMLVKKETLLNLGDTMPKLEAEQHSVRWETLNIMAERYKKDPEEFITVTICQ